LSKINIEKPISALQWIYGSFAAFKGKSLQDILIVFFKALSLKKLHRYFYQ